jgi:iron complex outermembrane receptor protein
VALVAGTQFLHATRDRTVLLAQPGIVPGSTEFNLWSPKVGVLWQANTFTQVFANISRSAEVPSFGESSNFPAPVIPFFQIRPQTATTYEVGTRGRLPDVTWDIALYRAEIRNELQCIYSAFGNCNVINADRTVHQGLELGFGAAIMRGMFAHGATPDRLWLNVAYTFNDFFFDRDATFGNNRLPGAPRHFLRAELLYRHPSGFYFGPNVEWVPEAYFVDSANTLTTEPYAIWGLKAGYETKGWSVYVEGRNLSNKAYIASTSIINQATPALPLFEPGIGRAVFAGIRAKL